ncbi:hypothetical protein MRX96_008301 [Rhipicephalus microplus]
MDSRDRLCNTVVVQWTLIGQETPLLKATSEKKEAVTSLWTATLENKKAPKPLQRAMLSPPDKFTCEKYAKDNPRNGAAAERAGDRKKRRRTRGKKRPTHGAVDKYARSRHRTETQRPVPLTNRPPPQSAGSLQPRQIRAQPASPEAVLHRPIFLPTKAPPATPNTAAEASGALLLLCVQTRDGDVNRAFREEGKDLRRSRWRRAAALLTASSFAIHVGRRLRRFPYRHVTGAPVHLQVCVDDEGGRLRGPPCFLSERGVTLHVGERAAARRPRVCAPSPAELITARGIETRSASVDFTRPTEATHLCRPAGKELRRAMAGDRAGVVHRSAKRDEKNRATREGERAPDAYDVLALDVRKPDIVTSPQLCSTPTPT